MICNVLYYSITFLLCIRRFIARLAFCQKQDARLTHEGKSARHGREHVMHLWTDCYLVDSGQLKWSNKAEAPAPFATYRVNIQVLYSILKYELLKRRNRSNL
jgi:hypothetical protein